MSIPAMHLVPDFLDPPCCRRVRAAMDRGERDPAEIIGAAIRAQPQVRRAASVEVDAAILADIETRLDAARGGLEAAFGPLGEREGTGLLRYERGGFYRPHRDRGEAPGWPAASRRFLAVLIFLNADFAGGALRLYQEGDRAIDITPAEGTLVAFRADTLHEALPVTDGVRDVAVDWFYDCDAPR